jgi:hypothetical protein
MIRRLVIALALLIGVGAIANAFYQSRDSNYNISVGGAPFQGMADVVSSPAVAYSLRALSSATRGNKLINLCDNTGANCADASSDASTGDIVVTTRGANNCATSDTCLIKIWYDLTANNNCSGPCDQTQATSGNMAKLVHNCTTHSKFCATFTTVNSTGYTSPTIGTTGAQPYWISSFSFRNTGSAAGDLLSTNSVTNFGYTSSANQFALFSGANATATAADNTWNAIQGLANGASSSIYVNGSLTGSLAAGSTNWGGVGGAFSAISCEFGCLDGKITEVGIWYSNQSANNAAMDTNQRGYW